MRTMARPLVLIALALSATHAGAQVAPARPGAVRALPDSEGQAIVAPFLRADSARLLQPVFVGPTGAVEWPRNSVLDWNGQAFVRAPALERLVLESSDLTGARNALAAVRSPRP